MTTASRHAGDIPPVDHHLRPVITYSSPSRTMVAAMLRASEDATSGSLIEKHERICPASSGASQRCDCSGVANMASSSMLPVSGAAQFIASGMIHGDHPLISATGA